MATQDSAAPVTAAAASPQEAPPEVSPPNLVDELRSISANLKNVRQAIVAVAAQAAGIDGATDARFTQEAQLLNNIWSSDKKQVDQSQANIATWVSQKSTTYRFELEEIHNVWDRICFLWPADNSWTRENASALAESLMANLDDLIEKCAFITLTPRIQEHLRTIRVGRYKNFADIAQGETVDEEMNKRLLKRFAASPEMFDGIFDIDRMRIARLDRGFESKRPALIAIGVTFFGLLGLSIAAYYFRDDIPYADQVFGNDGYAAFLIYIVLAFVGALGHVVLKARTAQNADGTAAGFMEGLDWVALNYTSVCWSILAVWIACVVARTNFLEIDSQMSGLVVGYSADSIVDSFTSKFKTYLNTEKVSALDKLQPQDA